LAPVAEVFCLGGRGFFRFTFPQGVLAMTQSDLNRAVSRSTGESVSTIKRLGFLLADPLEVFELEADGPYVIDWDQYDADRFDQNSWSNHREPAFI
jgi:hypothetical protein